MKKEKFPTSFSKAIREKCRDCSQTKTSILFCSIIGCPIWFFRLGCGPKAAIKNRGKKYEQIFIPKNFVPGEKFGYPKDDSECIRAWK